MLIKLCKNSIVFIKNKNKMPINARSLPEFNVSPSEVIFTYKKKKKKPNPQNFLTSECMQMSNTAKPSTLCLLALYAHI